MRAVDAPVGKENIQISQRMDTKVWAGVAHAQAWIMKNVHSLLIVTAADGHGPLMIQPDGNQMTLLADVLLKLRSHTETNVIVLLINYVHSEKVTATHAAGHGTETIHFSGSLQAPPVDVSKIDTSIDMDGSVQRNNLKPSSPMRTARERTVTTSNPIHLAMHKSTPQVKQSVDVSPFREKQMTTSTALTPVIRPPVAHVLSRVAAQIVPGPGQRQTKRTNGLLSRPCVAAKDSDKLSLFINNALNPIYNLSFAIIK